MQSLWLTEEVGEHWILGAEDLAWLSGLPDAGKLGLAVQLMYWRRNGRFPDDEAVLAPAVVRHLAAQIGVGVEVLEDYEWTGRTGRRHRRLVLDRLAVASFDERAEARLRTCLSDALLVGESTPPALEGEVRAWFARERAAARGREDLVVWLKHLENRSRHTTDRNDPVATYDFTWMWRELNVDHLHNSSALGHFAQLRGHWARLQKQTGLGRSTVYREIQGRSKA